MKHLLLFNTFILLATIGSNQLSAQSVTMGGDFSPAYTGSATEWLVGGDGDNDGVGDSALRVGINTNGSMLIEDGGIVSNSFFGFLGNSTGSEGTATISGAGSQWNNSGSMIVGRSGKGTLNVNAGGVVSNRDGRLGDVAGSEGTATISGAGSQWNNSTSFMVGWAGKGTLHVESGGVVSNSSGRLGFVAGSDGTATISGVGSRWNNSGLLAVGSSGKGTLNVNAGGVVSNFYSDIGDSAGSEGTATISGAGSQWNNDSVLYVGRGGKGTLNVSAGGVVSSLDGRLGSATGSEGTATISGVGSQWNNSSNIFVGSSGKGTLNVESDGVISSQTGYLGQVVGADGNATISGAGQWNNTGSLFVGGSASSSGGTGTLNIQSGGLVTTGDTLKVWDDGTVNLSGGKLDVGTLDLTAPTATAGFNMTGGRLVVDTIMGNFQQDGGTLAPGDSPGLTSMVNDYNMIAGVIEFEIEGDATRGVDFDAIDVAGIATLNGTMNVNFINGFTGVIGQSFQLVDAADIVGTPMFDFSDAVLSSGLAWDTRQFLDNGTIFIASVSAVPEPTSLFMFGLACSCLAIRRRGSHC